MFTRKQAGTIPNSALYNGLSDGTLPERASLISPLVQSTARLSHPLSTTSIKPSPQTGSGGDGVVLIGRNTKIMGDITDCSMIEIQGVLEGTVVADVVVIREGGGFRGSMQTDNAEVHGVLEGTIVVHELLDVRATGSATGELTYGRMAVCDGGMVAGNLRTKVSVADHEKVETVIALSDAPPSAGFSTTR